MITQLGQLNVTALQVPDLYVQIVPPQTQNLNGVPTNILGQVGTATWGPVNAPTTVGNLSQYAAIFGAVQNRKYDMGTPVAIACQLGANNFKCVRVTDGTDTAATANILTGCLTVTSKYSGSFGNGIKVILSPGSQTGTFKAVIAAPGLVPESFDNLGLGLTGNALWVAIAAAINNGASSIRGASQIVVATAGVGAAAVASATYSLAGGTDGATTITGAVLVGTDVTPRTGMYALRNTQTSIAILADCDDSTTWASQVAYGLGEGTYMLLVGPSGDSISTEITTKATAGLDSYAAKLLFGDWAYWLDSTNGLLRVVSPQGFEGGMLASLSPEQSSLNKQMSNVVGTQKSYTNTTYSDADLQQLVGAGIDLITNPVPGGSYFGARVGHNSSSNPVVNGDNYTRMTNYIVSTLNAGMGIFVGKTITPTLQAEGKATLGSFLDNLEDAGMIDSSSVVINASDNSPSRIAAGFLTIAVQVKYLAILEKLICNVEGGTSVQIIKSSTALAA
jgi:phage tail sheath protein FI